MDWADYSDLHLSRTSDSWNVPVKRHGIWNHETKLACTGRESNVSANTKRSGLSVSGFSFFLLDSVTVQCIGNPRTHCVQSRRNNDCFLYQSAWAAQVLIIHEPCSPPCSKGCMDVPQRVTTILNWTELNWTECRCQHWVSVFIRLTFFITNGCRHRSNGSDDT